MSSGARPLLRHTALGSAAGLPLGSAELTDRQKVGVMLQVASILSLVELHGGVRIGSWTEARIGGAGALTGLTTEPGPETEPAQVRMRALTRTLFGARREIAGRGEARSIARRLMSFWSCDVMPLSPDEAVRQILDLAGFIWAPGFTLHRAALAGKLGRKGTSRLWIAGPGWFRAPLLRSGKTLQGVRERLQSEEARRIWNSGRAFRGSESPSRRWRSAAVALQSRSLRSASDRVARAAALKTVGRFAEAVEELGGLRTPEVMIVRARCLERMGEFRRALREVERLENGDLPGDSLLEASSIAVSLYLQTGRRKRAQSWASRALRGATSEAERCGAELLGFAIAVSRADGDRAARHLESAGPAAGLPDMAWRLYRARAEHAARSGRYAEAEAHLRSALTSKRRSLSPIDAARLWIEMASVRRESGDLASGERALLHAVRLQRDAVGSEGWIRALARLAEIRLRRRGPAAAKDALNALDDHRGSSRSAGLELLLAVVRTRHELARGRAEAAIDVGQSSLKELSGMGFREEEATLRVLLARACGWLGRRAEAREILAEGEVGRPWILEPEERPALWILAGCRRNALGVAEDGPAAAVWNAVLDGRQPQQRELDRAGALGRFRYGRLIVDLEAAMPECLPRHRVADAATIMRDVGADEHATRLEHGRDSRWRALATFLSTICPDVDAVARLFDDSGYGNVRLLVGRAGEAKELIVAGDGGDRELTLEADGVKLEIHAPAIDSTLQVFANVVVPVLGAGLECSSRPPDPISGMIGETRVFRAALERLRQLAPGEMTVLLQGETGTGKEMAAREMHARSTRGRGPFVPFNCAAVSGDLLLSDLFGHVRGAFTGAIGNRAGVFEAALGGTVFLDEVGDLPLRAQGFLLRVLQEGEVRRVGESRARHVDVRVVSATHRDLEVLVGKGDFRADLFYRLRGACVELPPLRRRSGDIPLLARHLLERVRTGASRRLTKEALEALERHDWPGNIRELENVLSVAVQFADNGPIRCQHLELPAGRPSRRDGYHERVRDYRRSLVREAMIAGGGNGAEAARRLGVTRQALSYLVRSLGVDL